jgi:hypothetical protein
MFLEHNRLVANYPKIRLVAKIIIVTPNRATLKSMGVVDEIFRVYL